VQHPASSQTRRVPRVVLPTTRRVVASGRELASRFVVARAEFDGNRGQEKARGGGDGDDSLVQVTLGRVQSNKDDAASSILYLSLKDGSGSVVPVYVGRAECEALKAGLPGKPEPARPIAYDLFKSFTEATGCTLSHVVIDDLRNKTYHATCYFSGEGLPGGEVALDSRPSDALNLASRFNKPVFVTRRVLGKARNFLISEEKVFGRNLGGNMNLRGSAGDRMTRTSPLTKSGREEIEASVRKLLIRYVDPEVVELQVRLQVAVSREEYDEAASIRDCMEALVSKDRMASVCVAMESAVDGKRFEEAAVLRNTFLFLKEQKAKEDAKRERGAAM